MKEILDDVTIRNLKPKEKEYTMRERGGFGIRVYPSGRKMFFYLYRIDGKRKYIDLGEYGRGSGKVTLKAARDEYDSLQAKVKAVKRGENGAIDPSEASARARHNREEDRKTPTVERLIEDFVEKWVKKTKSPRSAYNDERALRTDVLPRWKNIKARDIRRRDAIALLEEVATRAPGQAQYLAKVCRKMFSFGLQREVVEINPFVETAKTIPELAPNKRERHLSAKEVAKAWNGIDTGAGSDAVKNILKLILVTGQRPSEVAGIRRSEIAEEHWWTIPAERTKNRKTHRVYLTDLALSLLPEGESDMFFPSPRPESTGPIDVGTLSFALKRSKHYNIPHWTPHDLRRTARTFFAEIGIPREHAEIVLNHAFPGVEGTYNRYRYDKEKQAALAAWEQKLLEIVQSKTMELQQAE